MAGEHEHPITVAEFTAALRPEGKYIAAIASYSPDPENVNRYALYREQETEIEWVADAWLSAAEARKLTAIPNLRPGETDAMYAVDASLVWTGEPMKIWYREKIIFQLLEESVLLHGREIRRSEIRAVHAYLDRGWVECGLRLVLPTEEILITRQENEIASIDITYDGFNLMADTNWAVTLGRLLSEKIGCLVQADEDLR